MIVAVMICATADAQLISSRIVTKEKEKKESGMILELGVGALGGSVSANGYSANIKSDGISMDLGLGYRKVFTPYVAWDILKLRAFGQINDLGSTITSQLLTAVRGTSPVLFANAKVYASAGLGYGYVFDLSTGGLCYEIQAGLDITPSIYLGLVYSAQKFKQDSGNNFDINYNLTFTGLRVGYKF